MPTENKSLSGTLIPIAQKYAEDYLKSYSGTGLHRSLPYPGEGLWHNLAKGIKEYAESIGCGTETLPNPEETAVSMIRSGVPESSIKARHKSLTFNLENGEYRIYRTPSGYPSGAVRVLMPGISPVMELRLTPPMLANLLLELDESAPEIKIVMDKLGQDIKAVDFKKNTEAKAKEIEKQTVKTLLDTILVPQGFACSFKVKDGIVSLTLMKGLHGEIQMPFEELSGFISDVKKVEGLLETVPVEEARDLDKVYFGPSPSGFSRIINHQPPVFFQP